MFAGAALNLIVRAEASDGDAKFALGAGQRDGSRESSRPQAGELL